MVAWGRVTGHDLRHRISLSGARTGDGTASVISSLGEQFLSNPRISAHLVVGLISVAVSLRQGSIHQLRTGRYCSGGARKISLATCIRKLNFVDQLRLPGPHLPVPKASKGYTCTPLSATIHTYQVTEAV